MNELRILQFFEHQRTREHQQIWENVRLNCLANTSVEKSILATKTLEFCDKMINWCIYRQINLSTND